MKEQTGILRVLVFFCALFALGGFLHNALYGLDFATTITTIYYGFIVILWGVSVHHRIVDLRVRRLFMWIAALLCIYFFLQASKYTFFGTDEIATNLAWYLYYIPLVFIPLLIFYVSLYLNMQEDEHLNHLWYLLFIPAGIFVIAAITNNSHNLMFIIEGVKESGAYIYKYNVVWYAVTAWEVVLYGASLIVFGRKCHIYNIKKLVWIPWVFAFGASVLLVLTMLDLPKIFGISVWKSPEAFAFLIIGVLELCIQTGLIQANTDYQVLFTLKVPATICDLEGKPIYTSADNFRSFGENVTVKKSPIRGGSVFWAVDLAKVNKLNAQIKETTEQIESRNEVLRAENSLKEEQASLDTRNKVYDDIARIVKPQLDATREIMSSMTDEDFKSKLSHIAVLNSYIKRRSNMELLRADSDKLTLKELSTAISETCEYIKLCGISATCAPVKDCETDAERVIYAYEFMDRIVENEIDNLKSLLINISFKENVLILRMLLSGENEVMVGNDILSGDNFSVSADAHLTSETEDGETTVTLKLSERRVES